MNLLKRGVMEIIVAAGTQGLNHVLLPPLSPNPRFGVEDQPPFRPLREQPQQFAGKPVQRGQMRRGIRRDKKHLQIRSVIQLSAGKSGVAAKLH